LQLHVDASQGSGSCPFSFSPRFRIVPFTSGFSRYNEFMNAPSDAARPFRRGNLYNSYGAFLREKFDCRVHKIIVDAGFTCPNRDGLLGSGGCTYCNNDAFRPASAKQPESISLQVRNGMEYLRHRYRARKFIAYFQPFTNTYGPLEQLVPIYESALCHPDIVGIAVGTRPDCIDEEKLSWFAQLARSCFVALEYGLESIYDRTLERIHRGHDFACWAKAVARTRDRGIHIGVHLILGFPWETREEMLAAADVISHAGLHFLKLHHLHVVRGTELAREYEEKPFPMLSCGEYVNLVVDFLERLNPDICVERLFGIAPDELLIAPRWSMTKAELQHAIEQALAERKTFQGRLFKRQNPM
jgi:radical SAM protein (TIGR01212 family)